MEHRIEFLNPIEKVVMFWHLPYVIDYGLKSQCDFLFSYIPYSTQWRYGHLRIE